MAQADFNHFTYLSPEQLRKLARILYFQEAEANKNIRFEYEAKLAKYLRHCKACYESAIRLLDSDSKLEPWFNNDDKDRATILNAASHPLQFLRNFHVRMDYVNKIGEHIDGLPAHLDDVLTIKELELARKASEFRNDMMEIARGSQSPALRQYSRWIKETGSRLKNYCRSVLQNHICNRVLLGAAGIAVLFSAGITVWGIFSANIPLQTVARDAVTTTTSIGGAMIGEVVGVALVSMVIDNGLLVLKAGITAGISAVFLIGEFNTWLINVIFGSGGHAPLSTMGHRCYVAHLPDGSVLARQIAHQQS